MSTAIDIVTPVCVPQVNVNDDRVTLIGWYVGDGGRAVEGEPLCEVETSKAAGDVPSPVTGVLRHGAQVGDDIPVGGLLGYIGPSVEAIEQYVSSADSVDRSSAAQTSSTGATAGAIEATRRYGLDLSQVSAAGKVRRADVERCAAEQGLINSQASSPAGPTDEAGPPAALCDVVSACGELSAHQWSIAQHLAATQIRVVSASVTMDVNMSCAIEWISAKRRAGTMVSLLPLLIHAAGQAVRAHDSLARFRLGRRLFRYPSIDIAYTASARDGRLFTPVVRGVDERTLDDLACECTGLNMTVIRETIKPTDLTGACLTVSILDEHPVRSHVGLQNAWQSAVLTAGAVWDRVELVEGRAIASPTVTLVLSYDHGLMDGHQAGASLATVKETLEAVTPPPS